MRRIVTAREQAQMLAPWRVAALDNPFLDSLRNEFHEWNGTDPNRAHADHNTIGNWGRVEDFLSDRYPATYRGFDVGRELTRPFLRRDEEYDPEHPRYKGLPPYETGPEAVAKHGYDPKEIAAGFLVLHNRANGYGPHREEEVGQDIDLLADIAQKRHQMQRDYEQRTASRWDEYEEEEDPYAEDWSEHGGTEYAPDRFRHDRDEDAPYERPGVRWTEGPGGRSTDLWRAMSIPLDHPAYADHPSLNKAKAILAQNPHPHPDSPEGQEVSDHLLDFMEDVGRNVGQYREQYTKGTERSRIPFTKTHDTSEATNLGRHWGVDPGVTQVFGYPWDKGNFLSVMMQGGWGGQGEDLSRSNAGSHAHEGEITLHPGTEMNMKGLYLRHPHEWSVGDDIEQWKPETWHNVLGQPQIRHATLQLPYLRNNGGMRQNWMQHHFNPEDFHLEHEPWGRYMSHDEDPHGQLQHGWERGTVSFDNPLFMHHDYGAWKQNLAEQYGATGKQLSEKLLADGYDGVITHDKYGIGEIVDVRPKGERGHRVERMAAEIAPNDPLWDLLGLPPGGERKPYNPPEPEYRKPPDPIEGVPSGWEDYHQHISDRPDTSGNAHLWMPTEVADHYKEYGPEFLSRRGEQYQVVKKVIGDEGGIRQPLWISANDTHGLLVEGNNRLQVAKELGMSHVPVRVTHDNPILRNEGNPPAPHHPMFGDWFAANKHRLQSARD